MTLDGNHDPARSLCLEARITATDLVPVRASVERWLEEAGTTLSTMLDAGNATFHLREAGEGLSVFLNAIGKDADRTLALHGFDLVGKLADDGGAAELTWIRHDKRPAPALTPVN